MVEAREGRAPIEDFLGGLVRSRVFLPAEEDSQEADGSGTLPLPAHRGDDGNLYVPVFTSRERVMRFSGGEYSVSLPFQALAASWPEDLALVLDPGEPVELVLPAADVQRMARPPEGATLVPEGTSVMVGDPAEEPDEVLRAVADACREHGEIAAGYGAQIQIDRPGETPHLAIGLLIDGDAAAGEERIHREVAQAASAAGAEGVSVLTVAREPSGNGVADFMVQRTAPFYER